MYVEKSLVKKNRETGKVGGEIREARRGVSRKHYIHQENAKEQNLSIKNFKDKICKIYTNYSKIKYSILNLSDPLIHKMLK